MGVHQSFIPAISHKVIESPKTHSLKSKGKSQIDDPKEPLNPNYIKPSGTSPASSDRLQLLQDPPLDGLTSPLCFPPPSKKPIWRALAHPNYKETCPDLEQGCEELSEPKGHEGECLRALGVGAGKGRKMRDVGARSGLREESRRGKDRKPWRAATAYEYFCMQERPKLKIAHGNISSREINKYLG